MFIRNEVFRLGFLLQYGFSIRFTKLCIYFFSRVEKFKTKKKVTTRREQREYWPERVT